MPYDSPCSVFICIEASLSQCAYALRLRLLSFNMHGDSGCSVCKCSETWLAQCHMPLDFACSVFICLESSLAQYAYALRLRLLSGNMP